MENLEQKQQTENDKQKVANGHENADTLVDFLPIEKQTLSDHEAERLERLLKQRSPYKKD